MGLSRHINSFNVYNVLLIIIFSLTVNGFFYSTINIFFYVILHFLVIYLGIYYYRNLLYFIYFIYGLGLDLIWVNEIGPHLLIFMFILIFFSKVRKYLYHLDSFKIYSFILLVQIFIIFLEMFIANIFFNYAFNYNYFINIIVISLVFSFPIFLIFSKIDRLK